LQKFSHQKVVPRPLYGRLEETGAICQPKRLHAVNQAVFPGCVLLSAKQGVALSLAQPVPQIGELRILQKTECAVQLVLPEAGVEGFDKIVRVGDAVFEQGKLLRKTGAVRKLGDEFAQAFVRHLRAEFNLHRKFRRFGLGEKHEKRREIVSFKMPRPDKKLVSDARRYDTSARSVIFSAENSAFAAASAACRNCGAGQLLIKPASR
jgi:hypothetical protein